ncbi:hypothetical protein Tco_0445477 [Tanacetum coccineum]
MQVLRDRQKVYADVRRKPLLSFRVVIEFMLKSITWKGVVSFGKRGKLNLKDIGPFNVIANSVSENNIDDKLHFVEEPVEIWCVRSEAYGRSSIPIIKVRDVTPKRGSKVHVGTAKSVRGKYPHLFTKKPHPR